MNQILNMIFRIFMRKMISRGIDAGLKKATGGRKGPARHPQAPPPPQSQPTPAAQEDGGMTREQIRAQRRARRERRAARAARDNGGS